MNDAIVTVPADIDGIDLPTLLAPIAGENPAGEDLREDYAPSALYYKLRDARAEARAIERQLDSDDSGSVAPPSAQWSAIRSLAVTALGTRTKDLEVAAWLTESLVRSDGLVGLLCGTRLMHGLVEAYWDVLYPMPDEDGMETRVAPLAGLNGQSGDGTLIQPLRQVPLFTRMDGTPVSAYEYDRSAALEALSEDRRAARIAEGITPFDRIENEARAWGAARMGQLLQLARTATTEWRAFGDLLDSHAGPDSPPTGRVNEVLDRIIEIAERYAPAGGTDGDGADVVVLPGIAGGAGQLAGTGAPGVAQATGPVAGRDDALRQLDVIAAFFRRTEPNSPTAYTLAEAARRARMSWPELLAEIVPDEGSRSAILSSLGIKPEAPSE